MLTTNSKNEKVMKKIFVLLAAMALAVGCNKIDDAASLMHMMNANTFTAGAYRTVEGTDIAALTESIKANIQSNHWMCGMPEKMLVAIVGEYVVATFGLESVITTFEGKLTAAYTSTEIAYSAAITG